MNLTVTHTWGYGNFKTVFRIECIKTLTNFIILYHQKLCIAKQGKLSEMGYGREKRRPKGKRQNLKIIYEH